MNNQSGGEVRAFVASTFSDMREERLELATSVFPQVRSLFASKGIVFTDVDLRWGITEAEVRRGETVQLCLQEAHRADVMIALLGSRSGWQPPKLPPAVLERWPQLVAHDSASVTELEVQCWLAHHHAASRGLFYGVANSGAADRPLSKRLRGLGFHFVEYHSPAELAEMVARDLCNLVRSEFTSPNEENRCYAEVPDLVRRLRVEEQLNQRLNKGGTIALVGERGAGKSGFFAGYAPRPWRSTPWFKGGKRVEPLPLVLKRSSEFDTGCATAEGLLRSLLKSLDAPGANAQVHTSLSALKDCLLAALLVRAKTQPVVVVIDGADSIAFRGARWAWLPTSVPSNVHFVLLVSEVDEHLLERLSTPPVRLGPMDAAESDAFVAQRLSRWGKRLPASLHGRLRSEYQRLNPAFLGTLLDELRIVADATTLSECLERYLGCPDQRALHILICQRLERAFDTEFVARALSLVCLGRYGVTEHELRQLAQPGASGVGRVIEWLAAASPLLHARYGYFVVANDDVRQVIAERYLPRFEHELRLQLFELFRQQSSSPRSLFEMLHQARSLRSLELLLRVVEDPQKVAQALSIDLGECVTVWRLLMAHKRAFPGPAYAKLLAMPTQANAKPLLACGLVLLKVSAIGEALQLLDAIRQLPGAPTMYRHAACRAISQAHQRNGHLSKAVEVLCEALELTGPHEAGRAVLMNELGAILSAQGSAENRMRARELFRTAQTLFETAGDQYGRCLAQANVQRMEADVAPTKKGLRALEELIARCETDGQIEARVKAEIARASLLRRLGRRKAALKAHQEAASGAELLGDVDLRLSNALEHATTLQELDDYDSASILVEQAEALSQQQGTNVHLGWCELARAQLAHNMGARALARRHCARAYALVRQYHLEALTSHLDQMAKHCEYVPVAR